MIEWRDPQGSEHTGQVWAPGPADRSVWVLPDADPAAPVLVSLDVDEAGWFRELEGYRDRAALRGRPPATVLAEGRRSRLSRDDWELARFGPPPPALEDNDAGLF